MDNKNKKLLFTRSESLATSPVTDEFLRTDPIITGETVPNAQLKSDFDRLTHSNEDNNTEDFTSENIATSYGTYGDVVITVATHKFKLGANASRKEMAVFQQAMDQAYSVALKQYRPTGFTYALSSVGAVNPLSDLEVTCKMSEHSANAVGQNACSTFFTNLASNYRRLIK